MVASLRQSGSRPPPASSRQSGFGGLVSLSFSGFAVLLPGPTAAWPSLSPLPLLANVSGRDTHMGTGNRDGHAGVGPGSNTAKPEKERETSLPSPTGWRRQGRQGFTLARARHHLTPTTSRPYAEASSKNLGAGGCGKQLHRPSL